MPSAERDGKSWSERYRPGYHTLHTQTLGSITEWWIFTRRSAAGAVEIQVSYIALYNTDGERAKVCSCSERKFCRTSFWDYSSYAALLSVDLQIYSSSFSSSAHAMLFVCLRLSIADERLGWDLQQSVNGIWTVGK